MCFALFAFHLYFCFAGRGSTACCIAVVTYVLYTYLYHTPHSKAGHITLHLPDWVDDCLYEVPDMTYMGLHHSIRGSKLFASRKSFIGGRKTKSGSKKEMNGVFCCRRRQDGLRLDVAWDKTIWFFFFSFREEGRPTRLGHIG